MLEKPSPQRQRSRSTGVGRYPLPNPPESSPCPRTAVRRGTVFSSNVAPQRGMKDFLEKVDSLRCLRQSCQFLQFGIPDHSGGLRWQGAWTLVAFRCAGGRRSHRARPCGFKNVSG